MAFEESGPRRMLQAFEEVPDLERGLGGVRARKNELIAAVQEPSCSFTGFRRQPKALFQRAPNKMGPSASANTDCRDSSVAIWLWQCRGPEY